AVGAEQLIGQAQQHAEGVFADRVAVALRGGQDLNSPGGGGRQVDDIQSAAQSGDKTKTRGAFEHFAVHPDLAVDHEPGVIFHDNTSLVEADLRPVVASISQLFEPRHQNLVHVIGNQDAAFFHEKINLPYIVKGNSFLSLRKIQNPIFVR